MFTIGDFARHGRVSVRMLRHYHAIGLLRPAKVDEATGYRYYEAGQLSRLNRLIALKDLGFTLQHVGGILDEQVNAEELRGMLKRRHTDLRAQIVADSARLAQVEARLRAIEAEGRMPTADVVVKRVPALRLAELAGIAAGFEPAAISPVIKPLCEELGRRLAESGLPSRGPLICYYTDAPSDASGADTAAGADGAVVVHAGVPVSAELGEQRGLTFVDLPAITAATTVHRGSMDNVLTSVQTLARWIDAEGRQSAGYPREVYLETSHDVDDWVTELQEPAT
jgi:DNA-binding transcriptional MerR regulator